MPPNNNINNNNNNNNRTPSRRSIVESIIISWLFPMVLSRIASRMLSISVYSSDFTRDIHAFLAHAATANSTLTSSSMQTTPTTQRSTASPTTSLFEKVHVIITTELTRYGCAPPAWVTKTATILVVCGYGCSRATYLTFAIVFTLLCLMLTMRRKVAGFGVLVNTVIGVGSSSISG